MGTSYRLAGRDSTRHLLVSSVEEISDSGLYFAPQLPRGFDHFYGTGRGGEPPPPHSAKRGGVSIPAYNHPVPPSKRSAFNAQYTWSGFLLLLLYECPKCPHTRHISNPTARCCLSKSADDTPENNTPRKKAARHPQNAARQGALWSPI